MLKRQTLDTALKICGWELTRSLKGGTQGASRRRESSVQSSHSGRVRGRVNCLTQSWSWTEDSNNRSPGTGKLAQPARYRLPFAHPGERDVARHGEKQRCTVSLQKDEWSEYWKGEFGSKIVGHKDTDASFCWTPLTLLLHFEPLLPRVSQTTQMQIIQIKPSEERQERNPS